MRTLCLALAVTVGCTPRPPPRAEPLTIEARIPAARHAADTHLSVFVWPSAAPPEDLGPDDPTCRWWQGEADAADLAHAGLRDGSLRWGVIGVTQRAITLGSAVLVPLEGGVPAADAIVEGGLPALSAALADARATQDAWYETCGTVYRDRPLLVVDADVPARTVALVLQTAATLRFPRVAALVTDPEAERRPPMDPEDPGHLAVVRQQGTRVEVFSPTADRRPTGEIRDLEGLIAQALDGRRYGCTMVVARGGTRFEELAATVDATQAFRTHATFVYFDEEDGPRSAAPKRPGPAREGLNPDNRASVLWLDLPGIAWQDTDEVRCDAVTTTALGAQVPLPESLGLVLGPPREDGAARPGLPAAARARPPGSRAFIGAFGAVDAGSAEAPAPALAAALTRAVACADEAAARPDAPDEVALGFQVAPDGAVSGRFSASFAPSDPIHTCLADALGQIGSFPARDDGRYGTVVVGIGVR
jgi:hypothetical protein